MIKALFFDIDGTLVSFNTHKIPQSTISALTEAKMRGVRIFISTGRPMAFVNNIGPIEHLIDGYITTNGAQCTIGNNTVRLTPIPEQDAETLLEHIDRNNTGCVIMGLHGAAMLYPNKETEHIMRDMLNIQQSDMTISENEARQDTILQITPFIDAKTESELMGKLTDCVSSRWYPAFTDITSSRADKGKGLETMAQCTGIRIDETMAFGDGGNDIPILARAGTGVAMGNALNHVKAAADHVTTSVDEDGVMNALRHFRVIQND